jgi:hypothetical protein
MKTNMGGFSAEKGFFRGADGVPGGGGTGGKKDDENVSDDKNAELSDGVDDGEKDSIHKDQEPPINLFKQLKENLKKIDQLFVEYELDEARKLLIESLKLTQDYQSHITEEQQATLNMFINIIREKAEQYDSNFFEEKGKENLEKKTETSLEKQERHEVLLERMEKQFAGIKKYLQITKELGVDLTEKETKDLASDLKDVFFEFIDPKAKKRIRGEISSQISFKSEKLKQLGLSEAEKSILRNEIADLEASLQDPFTFIAESGFTSEQLQLIRQQYENYFQEIEQFRGNNNPNEEQKLNRAKKILESNEFLDFMRQLKKLASDSKTMDKGELKNKYVNLMAKWTDLGVRPRIFADISSLSYQTPDGQTISGEALYEQYKDLIKICLDLEGKLAETEGEFKIFNFRQIADEIMERQLDLFRFGDRRNPANQLDEKRDALDKAFKYWAFGVGSIFNNEHVVSEAISSTDTFDISLDKIDLEKKKMLLKDIFEFFKRIHDGRSDEANNQKATLVREVEEVLGLNRNSAEKWIVEAYKKVGKIEIERLEIKAELQTFFMDDKMQTTAAAAGNRAELQNNLDSYLVGRNELLLATTYHPEYGWLVRKLIEDLQAIASLRTESSLAEVVVKRLVKKQNLYAFSPGESNQDGFDYIEVMQRVTSQPQDVKAAEEAGIPVAEYLKEKLESMGETVVYLPDYQNKLINYNSFAHSEKGRGNLQTAMDVLISRMVADPQLKEMLDSLGEENLEKAKMFTSRLFTIFDSLSIILTEKQKNTTTRAHNGSIEDIDRISLMDPEAAMVHRMFRYSGNYSEATAEILALMSPVNAEHNLYVGAKVNKDFPTEQTFVYSELDGQGRPQRLRPVNPDYVYQLGKEGDKLNKKYVRADAMQLATAQRMQWEFYEQLFPTIAKMPLIRRRGFLEPLGFSTNQLIFLNPSEWERGETTERIWDYTNGSTDLNGNIVDKKGNIVGPINSVDGILNPKKEYVTELQHYNTAEKEGFLGVLERMYAATSSGGRLSTEQLFSSNKSILHDWFKAWGRIKMYPSPVVRDAFVPMTYLMIRRAVSALECVSGFSANFDEAQEAWEEVILTLESNLRDGGGLGSYAPQIATVINLLCSEPVYKILDPGENDGPKFERISRFKFEELDRGDYKAEAYRDLENKVPVGPKPGDFAPIENRRSERANYAISKYLYELVLKTRPYVKIPRPNFDWRPLTGKRKERLSWEVIKEQLKGSIGDFSRLKSQLERSLQGKSGGIDRGSIITRKGDPLVQIKEDKK